jgi:hypothetical protein
MGVEKIFEEGLKGKNIVEYEFPTGKTVTVIDGEIDSITFPPTYDIMTGVQTTKMLIPEREDETINENKLEKGSEECL